MAMPPLETPPEAALSQQTSLASGVAHSPSPPASHTEAVTNVLLSFTPPSSLLTMSGSPDFPNPYDNQTPQWAASWPILCDDICYDEHTQRLVAETLTAQRQGYSTVEWVIAPPQAAGKVCREAVISAAASLADHVCVEALNTGFGEDFHLGLDEATHRATARQRLAETLALAGAIGARAVVVDAGAVGLANAPRSDRVVARLAEALSEAVASAEELGVRLLVRPRCVGVLNDPSALRRLIDDLASWTAGAALWVPHACSTGLLADWLETLGPRLDRVYFDTPAALSAQHLATLEALNFRGRLVRERPSPTDQAPPCNHNVFRTERLR